MFAGSHPVHTPAPIVRYANHRADDSLGSVSVTNLSLLDSLIHCLDGQYQFRNHGEVQTFLREHASLVNVLLEALPRVAHRFGQASQIALEVVADPEDHDRKLFAFILTALPAEAALELRDQFDNEWWLDASERAQGQLIFDVEFI